MEGVGITGRPPHGWDIKSLLNRLTEKNNEVFAKICVVEKVDSENKTADLQPVDGSAKILNAFLIVDDDTGGAYLEPALNSLVCVVFVTNHIGVVVNTSELKQFRIKIDQTELQIDKEGFRLKKKNETLKKLIDDTLKEIQKMKFTTNTGSTISLVNQPQFAILQQRFNDFLKD